MNESFKNNFSVAISGIDGAGKTSLIRALMATPRFENSRYLKKKYRKNMDALLSLNPRLKQNPWPWVSNGYSSHHISYATVLDFLHYWTDEVQPNLAHGEILFCDRWKPCVQAFCGLGGGELSTENDAFKAVPDADLTLFLKVDPKLAFQRIRKLRQPRYDENIVILESFAAAYDKVLAGTKSKVHILESDEPEPIFYRALKIIASELENRADDAQ